ncbi:hypothetical protein P0F39_003299 [Vibrio metschnikovii]|nr:hypothetical protein [Vibrio metschnikovii]EKO3793843.1 hypothetical protein [Vibrio metschnikovii]EKO3888615.1 hypothetical protein [Vibrio metschnikovii]EKO3937235.1 hypothetical protein [Vibrio metschnikovii]
MSSEVEIQSIQYVQELIPLFSTLLGAAIAFAASFLSVKLTKDRESKLALEARTRERIERIYRLLVSIRNDRVSDMFQYLLNQGNLPVKQAEEYPALMELEMLIMLYFPTLEESKNSLVSTIQHFSILLDDLKLKNYSGLEHGTREKDNALICTSMKVIEESIDNMKKELQSLATV